MVRCRAPQPDWESARRIRLGRGGVSRTQGLRAGQGSVASVADGEIGAEGPVV